EWDLLHGSPRCLFCVGAFTPACTALIRYIPNQDASSQSACIASAIARRPPAWRRPQAKRSEAAGLACAPPALREGASSAGDAAICGPRVELAQRSLLSARPSRLRVLARPVRHASDRVLRPRPPPAFDRGG